GLLALRFVGQRPLDRAKRVHILDLDLRAKLFLPLRADGDVRVAAQRALLHAARVDAKIEQDGAQLLHVEPRLLRRADVWLADDLHQRDARAVQVDQTIGLAAPLALQVAPGVFLQVDARDANAAILTVDADH